VRWAKHTVAALEQEAQRIVRTSIFPAQVEHVPDRHEYGNSRPASYRRSNVRRPRMCIRLPGGLVANWSDTPAGSGFMHTKHLLVSKDICGLTWMLPKHRRHVQCRTHILSTKSHVFAVYSPRDVCAAWSTADAKVTQRPRRTSAASSTYVSPSHSMV
jgi:hypothetical protein